MNREMMSIAQEIIKKGGKPFLVGGAVRDMVLGKESKDLDIEVFGLSAQELIDIISPFGKVDSVGSSFGVIKLTTEENDFDFSLPRRESKSGKGHKGFIVESDPTMTPREAAMRRDFTFNALMLDLETMVILDFFGGLNDLMDGIMRATSCFFVDDPLRVLRGVQQFGRFLLSIIDESTIKMCKELRSEFPSLAKERVWIEFEKWAVKSEKPSFGLEFLHQVEWLSLFPELAAMDGLEQDKTWHPEGDCWEHTKQSVDIAVEISEREQLTKEQRTIIVFAALCHDMGKSETTEHCEDGHIRSRSHDEKGAIVAERFLQSIDAPKWLIEQVIPLVREHMFHVHTRKPSARSIRRLSVRLGKASIEMLCHLMECDSSARFPLPKSRPEHCERILELARQERCEKDQVQPILMGRHLIEMGMSPSPLFGEILRKAMQAQLDGLFVDLESGKEWLREQDSRAS